MKTNSERKLQVNEYVHTAEGRVMPVCSLGNAEKEKFDKWFTETLFNSVYFGRAEIHFHNQEMDASLLSTTNSPTG